MHKRFGIVACVLLLTLTTHMSSAGVFAAENSPETLDSDAIFHLINSYRLKAGLPTFVKDQRLCELAESRRGELPGEIFGGKGIHSGLKSRKLPYWVTENMKWGSSESEVVSWWLHSPIHRRAIYSDHPYSCGVCEGHICIQLFTSFQKKES